MTRGTVVVVGGGVVGATSAYYLARDGWEVTLVERGEVGGGCSHGNCGFVCPSHVLPLAAPGAVGAAWRSLFHADSPFRIKPSFNPGLWRWLWRFARRCNDRDMLEAARAIQPLLNSSRQLYDELMRTESFDCEWETRGVLFVYMTREAFEHSEPSYRLLRESFGLPAKRYDAAALAAFEPALKPGLAGAWLHETDAHLRPDRLMTSWRKLLPERGVTLREQCEFQGFVRAAGKARAVQTPQGEVKGDLFLVTTGAWTPFLNRELGCKIPIQPGKGYSITMPRPARCPSRPLILEEHRVAVTPMQTGYRLGSTMEFAGYDTTLNRRRLDYLRSAAALYLHEPTSEPVQEEWFGWRPMTFDSIPIVDRSPALGNVWIAAGHNMLGVSMAPATGKLIAELLGAQTPHLDPAPYRLSRF